MDFVSVSVLAPVSSSVMSLAWVVRSDDRRLAFKWGFLKQLEILACLVDTGSHQDSVTGFVGEAWLHAKVEDDVLYHSIHTES